MQVIAVIQREKLKCDKMAHTFFSAVGISLSLNRDCRRFRKENCGGARQVAQPVWVPMQVSLVFTATVKRRVWCEWLFRSHR